MDPVLFSPICIPTHSLVEYFCCDAIRHGSKTLIACSLQGDKKQDVLMDLDTGLILHQFPSSYTIASIHSSEKFIGIRYFRPDGNYNIQGYMLYDPIEQKCGIPIEVAGIGRVIHDGFAYGVSWDHTYVITFDLKKRDFSSSFLIPRAFPSFHEFNRLCILGDVIVCFYDVNKPTYYHHGHGNDQAMTKSRTATYMVILALHTGNHLLTTSYKYNNNGIYEVGEDCILFCDANNDEKSCVLTLFRYGTPCIWDELGTFLLSYPIMYITPNFLYVIGDTRIMIWCKEMKKHYQKIYDSIWPSLMDRQLDFHFDKMIVSFNGPPPKEYWIFSNTFLQGWTPIRHRCYVDYLGFRGSVTTWSCLSKKFGLPAEIIEIIFQWIARTIIL